MKGRRRAEGLNPRARKAPRLWLQPAVPTPALEGGDRALCRQNLVPFQDWEWGLRLALELRESRVGRGSAKAEDIPSKRDYLQVHVRFFAAHREMIGSDRLTVELPEGATAAVLVEMVGAQWPALRATLGAARVAVNREYATPTTILRDGDEVALIPPVAGGKN